MYSGIKQGADSEAASQTASDLSSQAYGTNQALENQAKNMENTAINAGFAELGAKSEAADKAYNMALKRRQMQAEGQAGLLGGLGAFGGLGIGALKSGS